MAERQIVLPPCERGAQRMTSIGRAAYLQDIAECDERLAQGDKQLAWLCQRVEQLRDLQRSRLARRDRLLRGLRFEASQAAL